MPQFRTKTITNHWNTIEPNRVESESLHPCMYVYYENIQQVLHYFKEELFYYNT